MSSFSFTVTQVTYNFTATVSNPATLTLADYPENVSVVNNVSTITVINNIQPVTISGIGGEGGNFNQSLNTTDNVAFASVTTPNIYGVAQTPVFFPTGIEIAQSAGTGTSIGVKFADTTIQVTAWRPDQLADTIIDFGSI
jgi:hypothetical protein